MKLKACVVTLVCGIGCGRAALKTALPPLDPRCSTERISGADREQADRIAPIDNSVIGSLHYYRPRSSKSDYVYGFPKEMMSHPWVSPDSAQCLRLAVARSPDCPDGKSTLDCRNDWAWWQAWWPFVDMAIWRIRQDQQSCDLSGLYKEYLRYPHSEEDKAATCLKMLLHDPNMHACLDLNKAALQRLVSRKQRADRQTYATTLFNQFFHDSNAPIWDSDYDATFTWLKLNLLSEMSPNRDPFSTRVYYRMTAVAAYRDRDREALLRLIAKGSREKAISHPELNLLARLEIRGDESDRLRSLGATDWAISVWTSIVNLAERLKREGRTDYDPIRDTRCKY